MTLVGISSKISLEDKEYIEKSTLSMREFIELGIKAHKEEEGITDEIDPYVKEYAILAIDSYKHARIQYGTIRQHMRSFAYGLIRAYAEVVGMSPKKFIDIVEQVYEEEQNE